MQTEDWDAEAHARVIVAFFVGGSTERVDDGGGAVQKHDFNARLADGRVFAVEVTRWNQPAVLQAQAEIDNRDWHTQGLKFEWQVWVSPSVNVKELFRSLGGELRTLEASGVREYSEAKREPPSGDVSASASKEPLFRDLHVQHAYHFNADAGSPGRVNVSCDPGLFAYAAPSQIVRIAADLARREDNSVKLLRAKDHSERHLFIWFEWNASGAVASTDSARVSPESLQAPGLPEHVDAVWCATGFESSRVWRYSRSLGWQYLGIYSRT